MSRTGSAIRRIRSRLFYIRDPMKEIEQNLDGKGMRIGIVLSRFNSEVGEGLHDPRLVPGNYGFETTLTVTSKPA